MEYTHVIQVLKVEDTGFDLDIDMNILRYGGHEQLRFIWVVQAFNPRRLRQADL